ncbi:unnamed protein product [Linum trigynum]|uniref:WAT1-related protein n=1 Tax=Linum trigynum TaxID=586398 RepID=A0AAV2F208_9ROSI
MTAMSYFLESVLPFSVMVGLELISVGLNTLFKAATLQGMSYHVFVVYDYATAALVLLPAVYVSRRSTSALPPLTSRMIWKICLLGLIGGASKMMGYTGINFSSPTLSSALSNLTPAFTFIFAVMFRMEKVTMRRRSSQAKIVGTIAAITGAFVITFYKGPPISFATTTPPSSVLSQLDQQPFQVSSSTTPNWILGSVFLTIQYILIPLWCVVLTQIMEEYPAELTVTFLYDLVVCIFAAVVALIAEGTSSSAWLLSSRIAFASVLCSGVFGSCMSNAIDAWALRVKGPLFVAMFSPFSMVIAVVMGVVFLGDPLLLGSLIGATIISAGFYMLMWGKAKEIDNSETKLEENMCHNSSSLQAPQSGEDVHAPLLQSYKTEQV